MARRRASGRGPRRGRGVRRTRSRRGRRGTQGLAAAAGRLLRALRRTPDGLQLLLAAIALCLALGVANLAYQIARKPTELFFVIAGQLDKTPAQTWRAYRSSFRRHSTEVMSPALLAALAQTEGSGNPVARTYWRFRPGLNPFAVYRPASSAVGMYQITDGTFEQARRFCIRDHRVAREGPWNDFESCWLNELYFRVLPSHAIEMTAAYLDHQVTRTLARRGAPHAATLAQKRDLATVIHLCGPSAGARFAARGFAFRAGDRCGDHDPRRYLRRVRELARVFEGWDAEDREGAARHGAGGASSVSVVGARDSIGQPSASQASKPPASGRTRSMPRRFSRSATRALEASLGQVQ